MAHAHRHSSMRGHNTHICQFRLFCLRRFTHTLIKACVFFFLSSNTLVTPFRIIIIIIIA